MLASRLWTLSLGAAIALTASSGISSAQSPKADAAKAGRSKAANGDETAKKSGDEKGGDEKGNRPPGFQIDPAVQLRALRMMVSGGMGGPGGMMGGPGGGGGRGGFGGGGVPPMVTLLLNSPELQEEIALTEDQKTKFKELKEKTDKERRELFTQMGGQRGGQPGGQPGAQNGGQAGGQNGGQAGGQRGGGNNIDREAMGLAMAEIGKKTTAEVSKILDKTQKDRLNQIELRILGVPAVVRPDIVK